MTDKKNLPQYLTLLSFFARSCKVDDPSSCPRDNSSEFSISSTKLESWHNFLPIFRKRYI